MAVIFTLVMSPRWTESVAKQPLQATVSCDRCQQLRHADARNRLIAYQAID
jgi:hypothetical protein